MFISEYTLNMIIFCIRKECIDTKTRIDLKYYMSIDLHKP